MYDKNLAKANRLYDFIDDSNFYHNRVDTRYRSLMNVPFVLNDSNLDTLFLKQASEKGLLNLKGHKSVGGMRASIYNALDMSAIDDLIDFMNAFQKSNA